MCFCMHRRTTTAWTSASKKLKASLIPPVPEKVTLGFHIPDLLSKTFMSVSKKRNQQSVVVVVGGENEEKMRRERKEKRSEHLVDCC